MTTAGSAGPMPGGAWRGRFGVIRCAGAVLESLDPPQDAPLVCPQGTCMPSRDLYALKGLVCPQGTCMPSRVVCPQRTCMPSRVVCPQRTCMPSEDLYALKGLVCPQGICMPSRDLYALKGFGPHGPKFWAQGAQNIFWEGFGTIWDHLGPFGDFLGFLDFGAPWAPSFFV